MNKKTVEFCFKSGRTITVYNLDIGASIKEKENFLNKIFSGDRDVWAGGGENSSTVAIRVSEIEAVTIK